MKIRPAHPNDIPAMAGLLAQLFAIETDFTPDAERQARGLALLLQRPGARIFVAEADGQVVGMCTVQILVSTALGMEVGSVEDVVVDAACRGRGIGAALLRHLEAWAKATGLGRLQLAADRDNRPAIEFYRRQGWTHTHMDGWVKPF